MNLLFSETLRKLRTEKGLTQQMLAEKVYVARSSVVRWETGSRLPDATTIYRLSEVLDIDVNMLLSAAANSNERPKVILVDDMKLILAGALPILEEVMPDADVTGFTQASDVIEYARSNRITLAFLDIELRNASGLDLCKELLRINPRTNVVFLTAYSDYAFDAWSTGASGFMLKPITAQSVREQLKNLRYPFWSGGEWV